MKFLKALLILLFTIMLLILGVFAVGAVNPDLSGQLADLLYGDSDTASAPAAESVPSDSEISEDEVLKDIMDQTDPEAEATDLSGSLDDSPLAGIADIPMTYVPPQEDSIEVSPEMSARTGFEVPTDDARSVEDNEANQIEDELGYGETGDGLDFDAAFYPYYQMLDDEGKQLYRQIYANANALNDRFKPVVECTYSKVANAFEAVIGDHPELFWLNTSYSTVSRRGGAVVEIDLSFNQTAGDLDSSKQQFNDAAEEILDGARNLGSDFEKEKYVHDALADKIDYNLSAPMNQSAYSALVNGSTVCAGYARAMQYLMQQLNIPCYYCTGYAGENHAWNIIKLDDDYYNVDVTWDDSSEGNYDYFNKSDEIFSKDHVRKNLSVYLPACNGTGYQVESEEPQQEEGNAYGDPNDPNRYIVIYTEM